MGEIGCTASWSGESEGSAPTLIPPIRLQRQASWKTRTGDPGGRPWTKQFMALSVNRYYLGCGSVPYVIRTLHPGCPDRMTGGKDAFVARTNQVMMRTFCLLVLSIVTFSVSTKAQTETVLYDFGSTPTDGYDPLAPVLLDGSGDLFGTTLRGGAAGPCLEPSGPIACGTVFELVKSSGTYTEKVLHNFTGAPNDGDEPEAGLISDPSGNLYGTTGTGGSGLCGSDSCGTVFEVVKSPSGYTESVLHMFTGLDGEEPLAGLIIDSAGNLYGTTNEGGAYGFGTVFELVNSSGGYTEKVLYSFSGSAGDGVNPQASLVMDAAGNLFGTTIGYLAGFHCSGSTCGTVFELVNSGGSYTKTVLFTFTESDGWNPVGNLILDSSGNLYGTTCFGGPNGAGTVFELTNSLGNYTEKVLHGFAGSPTDGESPVASLVMDTSGNLFGTTALGGSAAFCEGGCGTVFELVNSSGTYSEKTLHAFGGIGDGETPAAALVMDAAGNLYGTTEAGGSSLQLGTVFEINPGAAAPAVTFSNLSLNFDQVVDTSGPSQAVTITNSGLGNLIFGSSGVALSGPNAAEFAITADTCSGSAIVPKATCLVSVTFNPTVAAGATAALTFSDNAVVSGQTIALAGTGLTPNVSVTLSPGELSFSPQTVSTTSSVQTLTLMNSGGLPLNITSISASASFNETNNCGPSVASAASCSIQVRFAPTAPGPVSGTLSVTDGASGSPQTVALSGVGAGFTLGLAEGSPQSLTISPGASASYSLTIAPQGGFNQAITFACEGVPALATCSAAPTMVTFEGSVGVPLMVTVTTTAPSLVVPRGRISPPTPPAALLIALFDLIGLLTVRLAVRRGMACTGRLGLSAVLLLTVAFSSSSCGGGGSGTSSPLGTATGTPLGTYTLRVTATAGSLSDSTTLTLIVN
jgi:uncharacterized repeat protein (TIGR03803 family)